MFKRNPTRQLEGGGQGDNESDNNCHHRVRLGTGWVGPAEEKLDLSWRVTLPARYLLGAGTLARGPRISIRVPPFLAQARSPSPRPKDAANNEVMIVRLGVCICCALALVVADAQASGRVPVGSISATTPSLRGAAAIGTLVRLDLRSHTAEFRIKCGWFYAPKKRVRSGLWRVSLLHKSFGWETDLGNPAAPDAHVQAVSLSTWERLARSRGWSGSLRLLTPTGNISNGPTTDICAGTLG